MYGKQWRKHQPTNASLLPWPVLLSLLKYERIRSETSDGLKKKKKKRKTSYFRVTFTAKKKIINVILLFTCSYFKKDNPLMSEKEREVKVYAAGEMYLEVLFCVRQLKRQDCDFFCWFCVFCLKAI